MNKSETIHAFLAEPALAIVGVSRLGRKFGNYACRALKEKGYRVYPVRRRGPRIDRMTCYKSFADLPEPVGGVVVVVQPREAIDVIREAAGAGIRRVWLQQGAESKPAIHLATSLGLDVVAGECILMYANPTGIHRLHRGFRKLLSAVKTS